MLALRMPLALVTLAFITLTFTAIGQRPAEARAPDDAQPQAVYPPNYRYDWNIDGCPDIFSGLLNHIQLWKGICSGPDWEQEYPVPLPIETDVFDEFLLPGDWDSDGCPDMIAVRSGLLYLFSGDCDANVKGDPVQIGNGFDIFNFIVAPGRFDGDNCPDLIGRTVADGRLLLYSGDCAQGFKTGGVQIGTGWDIFDWISGPSDADHNGCADLAGREADGTLLLYRGIFDADLGACIGRVFTLGIDQLGTGWNAFDWMFTGGDWDYTSGANCSDGIGWSSSDPTELMLFAGDCAGAFTGPGKSIPSGGWASPFAGDSTPLKRGRVWGDTDCNGDILPRDAQALLKYVLQLDALSQTQPCPLPGLQVTVDGVTRFWGDWDCSGGVLPRDAQAVIKVVLVLPLISQTEPCPDIGDSVLVW